MSKKIYVRIEKKYISEKNGARECDLKKNLE